MLVAKVFITHKRPIHTERRRLGSFDILPRYRCSLKFNTSQYERSLGRSLQEFLNINSSRITEIGFDRKFFRKQNFLFKTDKHGRTFECGQNVETRLTWDPQ